jgi:hypothetical protein
MNLTQVHRLTGSAEEAGLVTWQSTPEATTTIKVYGGLYLFILSLELTADSFDPATMGSGDIFIANWSTADLRPQSIQYLAKEHYHDFTALEAPLERESEAGPRLIYQKPVQSFHFGLLERIDLTLGVDGPCNVTLIAIRLANIEDLDPFDMELR